MESINLRNQPFQYETETVCAICGNLFQQNINRPEPVSINFDLNNNAIEYLRIEGCQNCRDKIFKFTLSLSENLKKVIERKINNAKK